MDVSRGHLILRDDGGSTVAKRVKFNAVDPAFPHVSPNAEAEGLPREVLEDRQAQSKVERKEEMEFLAKKKLKAEDFGFEGLWVRAPYVIEDTKVPKNLPNDQLVDGRSLELNNSEDNRYAASLCVGPVEGPPPPIMDDQAWNIVRADRQGSPWGYVLAVLVYLDDLMIMAGDSGSPRRVSETWECDSLDIC
eukprot:s4897_g3.t1